MSPKSAGIAIIVLFCSTGLASAALVDDFNYADQASFLAAWPQWGTSSITFGTTSGRNGSGGVHGVATINNQVRNARNLDSFADYYGTDASPVKFEFWIYDSNPLLPMAPNGARNFNEIRAYVGNGMRTQAEGNGNLQGLIAMGMYNSPVSDDNYHARIYFGGVNGWYNLNTPRSVGWHRMTALIGDTSVKFLVDNQLDTTVPLLNPTRLFPFDGVVLGSGLTSGGYDASFDDLVVAKLPEPLTLASFALGILLLRSRRLRPA